MVITAARIGALRRAAQRHPASLAEAAPSLPDAHRFAPVAIPTPPCSPAALDLGADADNPDPKQLVAYGAR
jgi:hypothetical protein